jgi:hypothetical protein
MQVGRLFRDIADVSKLENIGHIDRADPSVGHDARWICKISHKPGRDSSPISRPFRPEIPGLETQGFGRATASRDLHPGLTSGRPSGPSRQYGFAVAASPSPGAHPQSFVTGASQASSFSQTAGLATSRR